MFLSVSLYLYFNSVNISLGENLKKKKKKGPNAQSWGSHLVNWITDDMLSCPSSLELPTLKQENFYASRHSLAGEPVLIDVGQGWPMSEGFNFPEGQPQNHSNVKLQTNKFGFSSWPKEQTRSIYLSIGRSWSFQKVDRFRSKGRQKGATRIYVLQP